MIVIESTGRKLKDAIDSGLAKLGKSLDEVEVQILDNGGLFRKAKVRITVPGEDPVPEIKEEPASKPQRIPAPEGIVIARTERADKERTERPEKQERPERQERQRTERPQQQREPRRERPQKVKESAPEVKERRYEAVTDEVRQKAVTFANELIAKMGLQAEVSDEVIDGELYIRLTTDNSAVIGYHGEVLDAIEYMTSCVINREPDKYYHIIVDCNGYRDKRKESLIALANKMAAKCLKVRHKVSLEPMNSNERKIIHSALADNDKVITRSEGHEPNRHIVILCKRR